MLYLLGVLVVVVGVGLSIALHEIGHLVPAKRFGVKVSQYMVGFGPTVWSRTRGETEYGVKAVPLGGYVRMIGMFPPAQGADPGLLRSSSTGRFSQLMDQARQDSLEQVEPGDEDRVFYRLSVPRKVVVMLGGPLMNLLIAAVLITGIITLYGVPVAKDGAVIASVSECVVPAAQASTTTTCAPTDPKTPAYLAGLKAGDKVVSVNGVTLRNSGDLGAQIQPRTGQPTTVLVERAGRLLSLTVTPVKNTVGTYDDQGQPVLDASGRPVVVEAGFLGVRSSSTVVLERQPVTAAPGAVWSAVAQTASVVVRVPEKMVGITQAAFGSGERDPNGPISVVGVGRVGGEIASADLGEDGTLAKLITLLWLIASLNLALFVFNLIPLLPLDGGHVLGALWEGVKRQVARLRGRPDPGYVDVAKALPVAYAVSMVLIVMSGLLIYADIVKPIKLFG
ncbi:MAG TPA: M50 family metallopeptidase [Candidatus Lustribacter sp.]|nr:M50 family metallopeptidase [Candidatus Lustribacter sp.]